MVSWLRSKCSAILLVSLLVCVLLNGSAIAQRGGVDLTGVAITSPIGTTANPQLVGKDGTFTITISVHNFTLDAAHIGTKPNKPGVGHYHVYADSFDPSSPFKFWIQAGATTTIHVTLNALAKIGVTSGIHTLYVVLANNDHSLLEPLALASTVVKIIPLVPPAALFMTSPVGTVTNPLTANAGGGYTFTVATHNFIFDQAHLGAKPNRPGYGHYHVYADQIDPSTPFKFWILAGASPTIQVSRDALAKAGVTLGTHTLYVALTNNDHSLLQPLVVVSTVIRLGPSIQVTEWSDPAHMLVIPTSGKVTLHLQVTNFTLDAAAIGKPSKPGFGHYHLYVDTVNPANPGVNYITASANTVLDVTGAELLKARVKPGIHTLYLILANNDHTLVSPLTGANGLIDLGG